MKMKSIHYAIAFLFINYFVIILYSTPVYALIKNNKASGKISAVNIKKLIYENPTLAIKYIKKSLKKHPKKPELYNYLGQSYGKLNENGKAILCYKKAIKLNPKYLNAYNNLGLVYNKIHNFKKAYKIFLILAKMNPKNPVYYNNIGFIEEERNKNNKAIEFFNKAVRLNPFYTMSYLNLGSIYRKMGKNRQAAKEYNKSGLTYFRVGNYMQAINSFKLSIKLYPRYIYPYENISNSYIKLGNIDKGVYYYALSGNRYNSMQKYHSAIKEFNLALQYNPRYMPAIHGIMLSYQKLGNMQMVTRYMQEEIKLGGVGALLGGGLL